ncbi:hypothetical protein ACIPW5_00065 [Streptomyces sp. NPDC090077]|uniref:hypothetical protein n=1 Tax=Streptomyces sp. NPDC090077 TaxID=3365938 RepID=UPI0038181092
MYRASLRSAAVAGLISVSLVGGMSSAALADSSPTGAERTGQAVEKATGTAGLLASATPGNSLPASSAGEVFVATGTGERVSIGLPETKDSAGVSTGRGTTVYPDAAPGADLAVQATADGARALVVIKDKSAPKEYGFDLGLPSGAEVKQLADGSLLVVKDRMPLGLLDAPWAKDANGNPVATSYRVEGNRIVQTVAFDDSTAFPVVADPNWKAIASAFQKIGGFAKAVGGKYADFQQWFNSKPAWVRYPIKAVMPGLSLYDIWWHFNH